METRTESSEETVREILKQISTDEGPDTSAHQVLRERTEAYAGKTDDLPFSANEVNVVVLKAKLRKAPGPDSIHTEAVREIHRLRPELFLKLFNKCLSLEAIYRLND